VEEWKRRRNFSNQVLAEEENQIPSKSYFAVATKEDTDRDRSRAMTPFRSEKDTNWEGAFRVPLLVRWPGKIPAGVISNEIVQHHDWLLHSSPRLMNLA